MEYPSSTSINHDMGIYEPGPAVDIVLRYFHKNKYTLVSLIRFPGMRARLVS